MGKQGTHLNTGESKVWKSTTMTILHAQCISGLTAKETSFKSSLQRWLKQLPGDSRVFYLQMYTKPS